MNPRQEAEKIVKDFIQIISNEIGYIGAIMRIKETAIKLSIKHVDGILEEILSIIGNQDYMWTEYENEKQQYWNDILTELKSM